MPEVYKHDKHKPRWPGRAYLLYLLAMPLLPALFIVPFSGDLVKLVTYYGAFASFVAGARFMKAGLVAEAEYHKRKIAAPPKTPRKLLGSLFTGAGAFICSWLAMGHSLLFAGALGVMAVAGATLFYGRDPKAPKYGEIVGGHGYTAEEVMAALTEAEEKIASIEVAARDIRNPELTNRLKRIARRARNIVDVMEDDPGGLRRARRFLNVYLDGARRVTEGYARTHRRSEAAELENNFRNVLTTIEDVFEEQHQKLLEHDALDLDVQIDVLSQQLKKQGVS
ncbi:MAG: 5-bromo-4-chloroindolyl phosphate hydrolase [Gammaproteobacteria bacterium]|nr:5-bromo-4-chloroindolyl phosphate hydrolase [Gammaproteobacteria bacterium]